MRYLAFDLGASSGKMYLGGFDGSKLRLNPVHAFSNGVVCMGSALYWDFPAIYRNLCRGIALACQESSIHSLGIDSFNNDFSFVSRDGELLMPLRSYRDERTIRHESAIYSRIPPKELYMLSGNQLAPFNTYMQLCAMVESGQSFYFQHAHRLLMLPDLLVYLLTGNQVIEYTLAAETQMLDLNTKNWLGPVLDAIPFPAGLLPPLVEPGTPAGRVRPQVCSELGIRPIRLVSVCQHDTASAFLAAPADPDTAIISSGTWSLVGMEASSPVVTPYGFRHNIANEGGMPGHHRLLKNVMGSWLLQELLRAYALEGLHLDYAQMPALALQAPPFTHMINVDQRSFYAPGQMNQKIATAAQQAGDPSPQTPGAMFRAVYEGLALKYRRVIEELEILTGVKLRRIFLLGGGAQDQVACQFTANATGRPVTAGLPQGTAVGNILAQMLASGEISSVEQGRQLVRDSFTLQEYQPQDQPAWEQRYRDYEKRFPQDP